ncbi:MAG: TolC family protein [Melioribacteraceae bacterium]
MKLTKNLIVLLLLFISISQTTTFAQSGNYSFSLTDCINYTRYNNPEIKKALIEEEKSDKKINEIIGSGLPQINLSGNLVNNLELPSTLLPGDYFGVPGSMLKVKFGTKYNYTFTGDINQMIFSGSFWVGLSAAKYSKLYFKQNTDLVSEDVEYEVAKSYYQTLVIQKQIQLLNQNYKLVTKSLNDSKLQLVNGYVKEVDVDRLNVSLNNITYQLKKVGESLELSYKNLKFKMGMPIPSNLTLADSTSFAQDSSVEQVIDNLDYANNEVSIYENRNDYKILETNLELLKLEHKNQIAKLLPTITAFGSYSINAMRSSFDLFDSGKDWFKYYSIGVKLQLPIFTGGQTIAKIQLASLNIESINEEIKNAKNGMDLQLSNSTTKYNNALDNLILNKQNIELAKKVLDITALEFNEGITSATVLIDSETKLREAYTNFANSLLDLYISKFDLEKAKGTLSNYLINIANKNN